MGLRRKANTKFYWADHTPLTSYTAWNTGEPSSIAEDVPICGLQDSRKESRTT